MSTKSRLIPAALFVVLSGFLGAFAGTAVGSFFVPRGSGFAGPAIALGYGAIGLMLAILGAVIFVRRVRHDRLNRALLLVCVAWLAAFAWLLYRFTAVTARNEKLIANRHPETILRGTGDHAERLMGTRRQTLAQSKSTRETLQLL